ncbi:protein BUNDLE SHEATH DEFECTIVE 2, chloroplastic isoform X3 [Cryptomeria japonica]|uniref:protein BUNDLE SHEATH DEFECTIVE 2, chloroplastic isoform X3 n=1 Tax=Cryptomeria japonica TaxID=3369 RepID=UPI0025AD3AC9|nr:protein BUNDLE SHEATH DEFECTIVE 2, chloroplastic isoform X3 [Cryptomeria japonica]
MLASSCTFAGRPSILISNSAIQLNQKPGVRLISVKPFCFHNIIKDKHSISLEQPRKRLLGKTKVAESTPPTKGSILCNNCDGNGMVQCSQCDGNGVNSIDHFNGRFKAGEICWLCRHGF